MPGRELPANPRKHTNRFESQTLMKSDACLVGQGDAGVGVAHASLGKLRQKPGVQGACDSLAMEGRMKVCGGFHRVAIGSPGAVRRTIRVAYWFAVHLGDQPTPTLQRRGDALCKFADAWNLNLERNRRGLDEGPVDVHQSGGSCSCGLPNQWSRYHALDQPLPIFGLPL